MKVTFYFVRHGKTVFNQQGRMQGMCDSPLLQEGIDGAQDTASALCRVPFASCYSSSSERAWDTAEILCAPHGLKPVLMKDLREFDFGSLDGSYLKDVKGEAGDEFVREDWSEYGGDTMESFQQRSDRAFATMVENSRDGDTVLVVSHGAYMMHLMDTLLNFDLFAYVRKCNETGRPWMPNCGICIFTYVDGVWQITEEPMSGDEYRKKHDPKHVSFTFVRHGETLFNTQHRLQGHCDSPLTDNGIRQAEEAGKKLADLHFDRAYVSSAERTRDTAAVLLKGKDVPVRYEKRLKEVNFGSLEGMKDVFNDPKVTRRFNDTDFTDLGGENRQEVHQRLREVLMEAVDHSIDGDSILLVSHGKIYFTLLEMMSEMDVVKMIDDAHAHHINPCPNCGIFTFHYENGTFRIDHLMVEDWF